MRVWKSLSAGDIVDVVAPGSGTSELELIKACDFLKHWKLQPRVSLSLFSGHPYLSNTDEFRFQTLKKALYAKDSKMIWCLRGGYGSLRLIPSLMKLKPPVKNKLLVGYSDITSLHLFLQQQWRWISCHGPLLDGLGSGKYQESAVSELKSLLFGAKKEIIFQDLKPMNSPAEKSKSISGSMLGGNLVVLSSHWGTGLNPKLNGKILFLEEAGERAYRIDRLLTQLLQSRAKMKAIILGDFIGGAESSGKNFGPQTLIDWAHEIKIPVYRNISVGHGALNRPLFFGTKTDLIRTAKSFKLVNSTGTSGRVLQGVSQ